MQLANHGGACCGIFHIFGMGNDPEDSNTDGNTNGTGAEILSRLIRSALYTGNTGRVIEVVTADNASDFDEEPADGEIIEDSQTDNWGPELIRQGFVAVCSFMNSNSSNRCTVWHKHPELTLYGTTTLTVADNPPQPVVRPEVRPILVEYCPNFRIRGRGRMFSAIEEVRAQYPLCRQIDRRTVYSDGSILWEEGV